MTVAVIGRDADRTRAVAADVAAGQDGAVAAYTDITAALAAEPVDALVIAAPAAAHRRALEAALEVGVAVLCEKPLVDVDQPGDADAVDALLEGFAERDLLLVENVQWPRTLPTFGALYPDVDVARAGRFTMRLSPTGAGRAMLLDSLSHLLSMLDALRPFDETTRMDSLTFEPGPRRLVVHGNLVRDGAAAVEPGPIAWRFELEQCEQQPRPAWYAIDDAHVDRRIRMPEYEQYFATPDGGTADLPDPLEVHVRAFVDLLRGGDSDARQRHLAAIRHRARVFREVAEAAGK